MTKIEFLDNNEPPLSADNLNAIQDNAENAINSVQTALTTLGGVVDDLDTIIETGSNANGNWVKYKNGTLIVTQQYTTNVSSWSTWGGCYSANLNDPPTYPVTFITAPAVNVSTSHSGSNFWLYDRAGGGTVSNSPHMGIVRPNNGSSATVTAYVIAIGKWK